MEGVRVGIADTGNPVPVLPRPALDGERAARGDDMQSALGVEHVG